jgi:dihydrofolate synthase/folylpolyglutamate synthase
MNDSDIEQLFSLRNEYRSLRYDLANIRILSSLLGNPHDSFRSVLIAGTNGKGTIARWLASMIPGAGLFTSPHLNRLNERIVIGDREIDDVDLQAVHDAVGRAVEVGADRFLYPPTYFERVTSMAFEHFRGRTGYAVVEVGLGGRLDATNILDQDVSVISSIGMDHCEYLGSTLDEIAAEKSGIIKDAEPVVIGPTANRRPVRERAGERLVDAASSRTAVRDLGAGFYEVAVTGRNGVYEGLRPRLAGRHQIDNLVVAVRAAEELAAKGWPIDATSIREGINSAEWPGRLESIPGSPPFLIDGGHNLQAAEAIARYLAEYHPLGVTLIFGAMGEKDYAGMLGVLDPHVRRTIVTRPANDRAVAPEVLAGVCRSEAVIPELASAIDYARQRYPGDVVLIAGSLYLAGEARSLLVGVGAVR